MKTTIYRVGEDILPQQQFGAENGAREVNETLEYFIKRNGWKKTKRFTKEEIELPDTKDDVKDIAECICNYGEDVAYLLITNNAQWWRVFKLNCVKHILNKSTLENIKACDSNILNNLGFDYRLALIGIMAIDIIALDEYLDKIDAQYDRINCTYMGTKVSVEEYVTMKYGKPTSSFIAKLLEP